MSDIRKEILDEVEGLVSDHGWTPIAVNHDDVAGLPPYAYSVGFERTFGKPEVVMIGFGTDMMQGLIQELGDGMKNRYLALPEEGGLVYEVLQDMPVKMRPVPEAARRRLSRLAQAFYAPDEARLLQMLLPDPQGRFPGDDDCDPDYERYQSTAPFES